MNFTLDELLASIALFARRVESSDFFSRIPVETDQAVSEDNEVQEPEKEGSKSHCKEGRTISSSHQPGDAGITSEDGGLQKKPNKRTRRRRRKNKSRNEHQDVVSKRKSSNRQPGEQIISGIASEKGGLQKKRKKAKSKGKKNKSGKEYEDVRSLWDVKHVNTLVRFAPQNIDLQGSRKMCVICQTAFCSERVVQHHIINSHGEQFALSPLLKTDNRNHTIERKILEVKLEQLLRLDFSFLLTITNHTAVTLLLKSVYVFDGHESLIPVFTGDGVLRMASGYYHEDEIHLEGVNMIAGCVYSLLVTVNPIDDERLPYDIVEQYHFKKTVRKPGRIVRTPLTLVPLPPYVIPDAVKILHENSFKKRGPYGPQELQIFRQVEVAKKPSSLEIENYAKQLNLLNRIEAEHLRCEFVGYTIERPKFKTVKKAKMHKDGTKYEQILYALSIDQFANRPSLIEEDIFVCVSVEVKQTVACCKGIVESIEPTAILILLDDPTPVANASKIEFHFNNTTFQLEQQALSRLVECRKEHILFPTAVQREPMEEITSFQWIRKSIASNEEQMMAVRNIVNSTSFPAPYVLFGPPGTGKSSTLVEAIGQIYRLRTSANILLVAPSNFAANEITTRLLNAMPEMSIFRFFSRKCLRKVDDIDGNILKISNMVDKEYDLPCYEDIYLSRVVVATMATAGRLVQANIVDKHFSYVIIDECGSAKEISALVPIGGLATCGEEIHASIVLAGDPKQLGPVIRYDFLKHTTHTTSLLERIMKLDLYSMDRKTKEYNTQVITQLRDSFRSHTKLLQFSNITFYDGQLRAKAPPEIANWALGWHWLPNPKCPLIFHPVTGQIKQDNTSFSLYNVEEGKVVLAYLEDILSKGINGRKVKQTQIGIISPYARQVLHLRELCKARGWAGIEIGSAEQYQGREKDIIIISTVRSQCNNVGFLADVKRLNVTITRARALMIVAGDAKTLRLNQHWEKFINYCRKNKAYVDVSKLAKPDGSKSKKPKKTGKSKAPKMPRNSKNSDMPENSEKPKKSNKTKKSKKATNRKRSSATSNTKDR